MQPDYLPREEDDQLEIENKCLRMKLMLESGAQFSMEENGHDLPLEIENEFLSRIIEFENHFRNHKMISIRERIGNPTGLKPASDISDEDIEDAWVALEELFGTNGISLTVCSPNVKTRDLYSFAIGEFLDLEMDDIRLPGMMNCFIYDEFYPDPVYECEVAARDNILHTIFRKPGELNEFDFVQSGIELNGEQLTISELSSRINRFKNLFEDLEASDILCNQCNIDDSVGIVSGSYKLEAHLQSEQFRMAGTWEIQLEKNPDFGHWLGKKVIIRGIDFI